MKEHTTSNQKEESHPRMRNLRAVTILYVASVPDTTGDD
jgi:hypothetical protein